jgi:pyroglutamyl-peptidase
MKILLTGFETFANHGVNPSQLLIQSLPNQYHQVTLVKAILPVDTCLAPARLLEQIANQQPDAVLSLGLAAGRENISLERVAINLLDFDIADNAGVILKNQPIIQTGPAAYFSTLPLQTLFDALVEADIPVELSLTAGAYLCNQVFYTLMHTITSSNRKIPAGFIHLPALPQQAAVSQKPIPSLSLECLLTAAQLILDILNRTLAV